MQTQQTQNRISDPKGYRHFRETGPRFDNTRLLVSAVRSFPESQITRSFSQLIFVLANKWQDVLDKFSHRFQSVLSLTPCRKVKKCYFAPPLEIPQPLKTKEATVYSGQWKYRSGRASVLLETIQEQLFPVRHFGTNGGGEWCIGISNQLG